MMISRVKKQMSGRGGGNVLYSGQDEECLIPPQRVPWSADCGICDCCTSISTHLLRSFVIRSQSGSTDCRCAAHAQFTHTHTHTHTQSLYLFIICIVLARGVRSQKTFWTLNLTSPPLDVVRLLRRTIYLASSPHCRSHLSLPDEFRHGVRTYTYIYVL